MYFSCKISHTILTYLEREGRDTGFIYEIPGIPHEFLRDPSSWLEAEEMEKLLSHICQHFKDQSSLIEEAAAQSYQLKSWGVLDSVLRMMEDPREIWRQSEKLFSYFVSPAPPVVCLQFDHEKMEFELPISSEQYPYCVTFLWAAFEFIPLYVGQEAASLNWQGSRLSLKWSEGQGQFFVGSEDHRQMSPELLRTLVADLEFSQRKLEKRNRQLLEKNQELMQAKKDLEELLEKKQTIVQPPKRRRSKWENPLQMKLSIGDRNVRNY